MALTQSSPVPENGARPRPRDAGWLATFAVVGLFELVRARIAFGYLAASDIPVRNACALTAAKRHGRAAHPSLTARMAYVLPRLSARLPWRSDCLIQAIAAQNWLVRHGLASEIRIGVERPQDGPFGAHAWLVCDGQVITGGDIARYQVLLGEKPDNSGQAEA